MQLVLNKRYRIFLSLTLVFLITLFQNCSEMKSINGDNGRIVESEGGQVQQSKLDTDQDGVIDIDDCEPENPAAWRIFSYVAVDKDGDGVPVPSEGHQCIGSENPRGKLAEYSMSVVDCNDMDATVQNPQIYYQDLDGDSFGQGQGMQFCTTTPPHGYSIAPGDPDDSNASITPLNTDGDQQPDATDCAPTDPLKFRLVQLRTDNDGDGSGTLASEQSVCIGSNVPPGYTSSLVYDDCDDSNNSIYYYRPLYRDEDGDGEGAKGSVIERVCAGDRMPTGYAAYNRDCNDKDATVKFTLTGFLDADKDGFGISANMNKFCANSLPSGWAKEGFDRDDTNPAVNIPTVSIRNYEGPGGEVLINVTSPINLELTTYDTRNWNISGNTLQLRRVSIRGYENQVVNNFSKHEKFQGTISQYCTRCTSGNPFFSYPYYGFTKVEALGISLPSTTWPINIPPSIVTIALGLTDLTGTYSSYRSAKYVISER